MKTSRQPQAKIVNHDCGMGAPDIDAVRKRAGELAQISGRTRYSDDDWTQAKRELHGGHGPSSEDGDEELEAFSERDMVMSDSGHHVENVPVEDAENTVEELIAEGMDEAVHEQMLEASKLADREAAE